MLDSSGLSAAPVSELERKVQWRVPSMLVFLGMMVALAAIALFSTFAPPPAITGLPDDPDVHAAVAAVRGRVRVDAGDLRFHSALLGEGAGHRFGAADEAAVGRAEALLRRASERHRNDPRLGAALAALELARRSPAAAEQRYRALLDRGARHGEARLGLGVAIALSALQVSDPLEQRRLVLRSIAQLAAVEPGDPCSDAALFDRALLLEQVGRAAEARTVAREYLAREDTSPWAERMRALAEREAAGR